MASRSRGPEPHSLSALLRSPRPPAARLTRLPCPFTSCLCSCCSFCLEILSPSFLPGELLLNLQTPAHLPCEAHSLPIRQKTVSSMRPPGSQRQGRLNSYGYWLPLPPYHNRLIPFPYVYIFFNPENSHSSGTEAGEDLAGRMGASIC